MAQGIIILLQLGRPGTEGFLRTCSGLHSQWVERDSSSLPSLRNRNYVTAAPKPKENTEYILIAF